MLNNTALVRRRRGGGSLYGVLGNEPALVADMVRDTHRADGVRQAFDDLFIHSRLGNATMVDSDGLLKWGPHNLALNSATPATQSITVVSGADYTVECSGSGSITLSGAGTGTVTEGNPVEVTASTTSLTLTVAGDVDLMWCYRSDLGGMAPVPLDARVAGSTTYVPTTSTAVYLPRRHNHVYNGTAWVDAGTLIETEARTNLLTYSDDFTNAAWVYTGCSDNTPDGDGYTPIEEGAATLGHYFLQDSSVTVGNTYTLSFDVKARENTAIQIAPSNGFTSDYINFDLSTGAIGSGSADATITEIGDGEYRVSASAVATSTTSGARFVIALIPDATSGRLPVYSGTVGNGVLIRRVQFEAGSTPSSYIPTSGSTVTRAADTSGLTIPAAVAPWPTPRVIGDESVTNGTFDSDLSGWTLGSDPAQVVATFDAGRVSLTRGAGGSSGFSQNIGMTAGKVYRVTFDVISGVAAVGTGFPATGGLSGSVELVKVATSSSISLWPSSTSSTTVIDNISVKEIDPLAVCISMKGEVTGSSYTTLRWYADANNYIAQEIGTSDFTFEQAASGTVDSVTGGSITSGVNVPFSTASRHGSTFVNGAVGGTTLTANTTPTALPDLSSTDLQIAYDFMGTIEEVRIWAVDIGDTGLEQVTS